MNPTQRTRLAILNAFAYRCEQLTPGEPIDDAIDLLDIGEDEDPILDNLRKALWSIDEFDPEEAAEELTRISFTIAIGSLR